MLLLPVLSFLSLEVKYLKHTLVLHYFQCSYSTSCRSPKILLKHCLQFVFGQFLYPGETENNFYGQGKQGVFWAMSEWYTEPLAFQCIYEISRKLTKWSRRLNSVSFVSALWFKTVVVTACRILRSTYTYASIGQTNGWRLVIWPRTLFWPWVVISINRSGFRVRTS